MSPFRRFTTFASILLLFGFVQALDARERTFAVGRGARLKVDVPAGYSFKTEVNAQGGTVVHMENPVWRIHIFALISTEFDAEIATEEGMRNMVVSNSADFLSQSKEQDYKFQPLRPATGAGVYCVFTDPDAKSPENLGPDEFMNAVVGMKVTSGVAMYFQILCQGTTSPEYQEAFGLFVNSFSKP